MQVKYRDVPGIDTAYLAMDTEEGVEVVWNEAQFSGSKKFKAQVTFLEMESGLTNFYQHNILRIKIILQPAVFRETTHKHFYTQEWLT